MAATCIYCLGERESSAFNVDHVIPRAFGMFEQNLTLDCVCTECNDYFGKTIELAFARDSIEAFLRLHHGVKPAHEVSELRGRRLSLTLGGDDDWNGCHVELKEEDGEVAVDLVPQVRFARRGGAWVFVREELLTDTAQPLPADCDVTQDIRLVSRSDEMDQRLIASLAARGIRFKKKGQGGGPPSDAGLAPLDVGMRFDAMIFRCVAKIAFNYMTWVVGVDFARADADYALRRHSHKRHGVQVKKYGAAVLPAYAHQMQQHAFSDDWIKVRHRLVGEYERRILHQRACDCDSLHLPA